ncbi:MAG: TlpA family protein disulfide reductase [Dehalococcoidia bacterium]|nr:TlpA family protein disulfide reductase [Dehalococcoidia bacterium]
MPRMSPRARLLLFAALPVALLFGLLAWALVRSGGEPAGVNVNTHFGEVAVDARPAKPFSLQLLSGETLDLTSLQGEIVMVDFWSSWCPPCREEAPRLAETYRQYRGRGVEFVGVAIWDDADQVEQFVKLNALEYPNGLDSKGKTAIDYGVKGIPEKFFLDRQGNVVAKFIGPVTTERLSALLDELLAR